MTGATSTEELSVEDSQNARGRCCGPAAPQRTLASAWEALQTGSASSFTLRLMKATKSMAGSEQSQNVQPRSSSPEAGLHTTVARLTARVNRSISSYASRRKPRDSSSSSRCAAQQEQHANERERHDTASGEVGDTCHDGGHTTAGIDATDTHGWVRGGDGRRDCPVRRVRRNLSRRSRAGARVCTSAV